MENNTENKYRFENYDCKFSNSSVEKKHLQTHTEEKQYSCQVCDASFSQQSVLEQHKQTHTGEKP